MDATTFDVLDAHTWRSDVNSYPTLDEQQDVLAPTAGPSWIYEYSTRDTYGANITWGPNDPLNATWWHHVTEGAYLPGTVHIRHPAGGRYLRTRAPG